MDERSVNMLNSLQAPDLMDERPSSMHGPAMHQDARQFAAPEIRGSFRVGMIHDVSSQGQLAASRHARIAPATARYQVSVRHRKHVASFVDAAHLMTPGTIN